MLTEPRWRLGFPAEQENSAPQGLGGPRFIGGKAGILVRQVRHSAVCRRCVTADVETGCSSLRGDIPFFQGGVLIGDVLRRFPQLAAPSLLRQTFYKPCGSSVLAVMYHGCRNSTVYEIGGAGHGASPQW